MLTPAAAQAPETPMRTAVIAHARLLSRALRFFDSMIMEGGTAKAVINGPVSNNMRTTALDEKVSPDLGFYG